MTRFSNVLSRRRLLLAPALLPFVPAAVRRARAAGQGPSRLLCIFHPNGLEVGWEPTGDPAAPQLGPVLAPLRPHLSKLTLVGGIQGGIRNEVQGHAQGMTSMWTGARIKADGDFATHPSFDQIAAARLSAGTPFRSLEFGVQTQARATLSNTTAMIYGGDGKPIPAEDDPNPMFDRMFGTATDPAGLARNKNERKSVLDLVRAQLADARAHYGTEDRRILDEHAAAIRQAEERLAGLGAISCERTFARHNRTGVSNASALFPEMARLQADLLVMALTCGLTRVASLQYTTSVSDTQIPGVNDRYGIHTVMHTRPKEEKVKINQWFVSELAAVLARLDAQRLPDGSTLLDDTLVVWGSEMAVGNHLNGPIPFVLAGGNRGGYFRHGRHVVLADRPRHTRLLVTALHALGLHDITGLGDFRGDNETGALAELRG